MTLVVKAADAAEFLALAPRLVGFTPTESLVVVPMARGRSIGALRVDLPAPALADQAAATVLGMVCRLPDAEAITAIVYTDASVAEGVLPRARLAAALRAQADACGIDVVDALCVTPDGWGSFLAAPIELRDLAEIVRAGAGHADIAAVSGDQWEGSELPPATDIEREAVATALGELDRAVPRLAGGRTRGRLRVDPRALDAAGDLDDLPRLFEDALDGGGEASGFAAALLVWCLARPALRDIALVGWARGIDAGDEALDAQMGWERGEAYPERLARTIWGEGPRPDPSRLERALVLARRLAALAPSAVAAGPLAVCAWLAWALGRSTHADRYASSALEADPEHGFAGIMLSFVAAGHLPGWAFHRPAPPHAPGDSFFRPR